MLYPLRRRGLIGTAKNVCLYLSMSVNKIFRTHGGKMAEEMKSWTGFQTDYVLYKGTAHTSVVASMGLYAIYLS